MKIHFFIKKGLLCLFLLQLYSCKKEKLHDGEIKEPVVEIPRDSILASDTLSIRIDLNNSNGSKCERLDGLGGDLSVHRIFSGIKLCNLNVKSGSTDIIYADNPNFRRDGSAGDVMVEIPKIYFRRYIQNNFEYMSLSLVPRLGYELDPAFLEEGNELDKIYVGVYDGFVNSNKLYSKSGIIPSATYNVTQYREFATNKGQGYGILDARTLFLLQRLFMAYYADRNSQQTLGLGIVNLFFQTTSMVLAQESSNLSNSIIVSYPSNYPRQFHVKQKCSVASYGEYFLEDIREITAIKEISKNRYEISFSGSPIPIIRGVSKIYGQRQETGLTDNVPHMNGNSSIFDKDPLNGFEAVKFLHMENLWGNVWNMLDGIVLKDLKMYIGENMKDYSSSPAVINKYYKLEYDIPYQPDNKQDAAEESVAYVSRMGYDAKRPGYIVPHKIGANAGPNQGYGDPFYSKNDAGAIYFPSFGGGYDHTFRCGLFTLRFFWNSNTVFKTLHSARLIYKPLTN